MPEEIAATPGWAEQSADRAFASLPDDPAVTQARDAYLACLAARKSPSAPSDNLGAEFQPCRTALLASLRTAGVSFDADTLRASLEALEAEIVSGS